MFSVFNGSGGEIYTVFDEESESEVQNAKFQAPEGKNKKKQPRRN